MPLNANGLRVSDVADVVYDFPRQQEFNYLNGQESLTVSVNKVSGSNLLEVSDRIKAEFAQTLTSFYHQRVEYPGKVERSATAASGDHGR